MLQLNSNNQRNNQFITTLQDTKIQTIKDLQRHILLNEPQSCQNQNQREKPILLKNFQSAQRTSNSQVATPKNLKFKQQIKQQLQLQQQQASKNVTNFIQANIQTACMMPLKKHDSNTNQENQRVHNTLDKTSLKKNQMKSRECNLSQITASHQFQDQNQSWMFSNEKHKLLNKSAEEERTEMSTTINYTSQNIDSSQMGMGFLSPNLYDDSKSYKYQQKQQQCSPVQNLNNVYKSLASNQPQNTQIQFAKQKLQSQSFVRANSQKTKPNITSRKVTNFYSGQPLEIQSPHNLNTTQQINKSYFQHTTSNFNSLHPQTATSNNNAHSNNIGAGGVRQLSNNSQKLQSKASQNRSGSHNHQQNVTIEIRRNDATKFSMQPALENLKPSSTQTKQSKQFEFNQTHGPSMISRATNSVKQSQKTLQKKSSTRSSRSNSMKKDPLFMKTQQLQNQSKKRHSEATKKFLKHNVMKNNFTKLDTSNAYDGDVSSVVVNQQQQRKKISNQNLQKFSSSNAQKTCQTLDTHHGNNQEDVQSISSQQQYQYNRLIQKSNNQPVINMKDTKAFLLAQDFQLTHHHHPNSRTQQINFHQYETFNIQSNDADTLSNQNVYTQQQQEEEVQMNHENAQELEQMRNELRNKDLLIQNLKERLNNLEDKVNSIHKEDQRDKSQQRIKDAIANLEQKLSMFNKEREENNQKLLEIRTLGTNSLHSSSRQSDHLNYISEQQQHNYRQMVQTMDQRRDSDMKTSQQIQTELEELESLITIVDGDDFLLQKSIKTPVFEDLDKAVDEDEINIIAQDGDLFSEGQQDNSCLMMLEKEWQEQQQQMQQDQSVILSNNDNSTTMILGGLLDQSKNIVFFPNEEDYNMEDEDKFITAAGTKDKFIKTQQIQFSTNDRVLADIVADLQNQKKLAAGLGVHDQDYKSKDDSLSNKNYSKPTNFGKDKQRKASFSKTMSKSILMNKIRQALNKQGHPVTNNFDSNSGQRDFNIDLGNQKKTPRRFIIKKSLERSTNTQNGINLGNQSLKNNQNPIPDPFSQQTFNPPPLVQKPQIILKNFEQPILLKQKIQMIKVNENHNNINIFQTNPNTTKHSLLPQQTGIQNLAKQDELLKTMVNQKEKVAINQKEALKREREISMKLRQAIQKMNFKMQIQHKQKLQIVQAQAISQQSKQNQNGSLNRNINNNEKQ